MHPCKLLAIICGVRFEQIPVPSDSERWLQIVSGIFEIPPIEFINIEDSFAGLTQRVESVDSVEELFDNLESLFRAAEPGFTRLFSAMQQYVTPERERDFTTWLRSRCPLPLDIALPLAFFALSKLDPSEMELDPHPAHKEAKLAMQAMLFPLKSLAPDAFRLGARNILREDTAPDGLVSLTFEQKSVLRTLRRLMTAERNVQAGGPRRAILDVLSAWASAAKTLIPFVNRFVDKILRYPESESNDLGRSDEVVHEAVGRWCNDQGLKFPFTANLYGIRDAILEERFFDGEEDVTFYDRSERVLETLSLPEVMRAAYGDILAALCFSQTVIAAEVGCDNQTGKFDSLWQQALMSIPDLEDRVRDNGEPRMPSGWGLIGSDSSGAREAKCEPSAWRGDTLQLTPDEALVSLLVSLFSDQELRIFISYFPEGQTLNSKLPGAGATLEHLAAETVALFHRYGWMPLLFLRLCRAFPLRKAEIRATQMLYKSDRV